MKTSKIFKIFLLVLLLSCLSFSQDSLYLVNTIVGTSTDNPLRKAQGIGDMNGDGYADFILCYPNNIDLYYGNSQFKLKPVHSFPLSHYYSPLDDNGRRGSAYPIGDVNGDGYADLMITNFDTSYYPAYPYCKIIFGGKELDTIPKFTFYPPYKWGMGLCNTIYPIGDINGDGYNDFAISSSYNWTDGTGYVYLFKGGKTISETPWEVLTDTNSEKHESFGENVFGIGDYNNDGYNDIIVSSPAYPGNGKYSYAYILLGNKDSISSIPYKIFTYPQFSIMNDIKPAGDLNGDGKKDFIITADSKAFIYITDGDPVILDSNKLKYIGTNHIGTGGDINGDGFDDYIIGYGGFLNKNNVCVGKITGFWGGNSIDTPVEAYCMEGDREFNSFGDYDDIPGDINGDGFDDVFIMQPFYPNYDFSKFTGKLFIYSYKKINVVNESKNTIPNDFILNQNYPNPFNPSTVITYNLPQTCKVTFEAYDILGKEIKILADEVQNAGSHSVIFNVSSLSLSSGVYFVKMSAESQNSSKSFNKVIKMMYLK